jgi:hypothetical protein
MQRSDDKRRMLDRSNVQRSADKRRMLERSNVQRSADKKRMLDRLKGAAIGRWVMGDRLIAPKWYPVRLR